MMSFAKNIGRALAYLQDTIDVFLGWAFHRLKTNAQQKKERHPLKKGMKAAVGFFAQVGDSFYQEYERLKKRHKK